MTNDLHDRLSLTPIAHSPAKASSRDPRHRRFLPQRSAHPRLAETDKSEEPLRSPQLPARTCAGSSLNFPQRRSPNRSSVIRSHRHLGMLRIATPEPTLGFLFVTT